MLQHRRFHIVLVDADSGAGDQPMQASKSVEYDGKAVKIQMYVLHHIKYLIDVDRVIKFPSRYWVHS